MRSDRRSDGIEGAGLALLESADPLLYRSNAFRVTGLSVDASAREISRQGQKAQILERQGKRVDGASGGLTLDPLPDADAVREAVQRLRDPERRLIDEFFWFWPEQAGGSAADASILALSRGDLGAARGCWAQWLRNPASASVALHNLAILSHVSALDLEWSKTQGNWPPGSEKLRDDSWRDAFEGWAILVREQAIWGYLAERIRQLDDPRLTYAAAKQVRAALPIAVCSISALLAVQAAERGDLDEAARCVGLLQGARFDRSVVDNALHRAFAPVREGVALICKLANSEASACPQQANETARGLLEHGLPRLSVLDALLPEGHPSRDGAHDEVALATFDCLLEYSRATSNWKAVAEIHVVAQRLAAGRTARERLDQAAEAIENNLLSSTCWFCRCRGADTSSEIAVAMHGEVTRDWAYTGTMVKWKGFTVKVPRCRECATGHKRITQYSTLGGVLGAVAGVVGCVALTGGGNSSDGIGAGVWLTAACGAIGAATGWIAGRQKLGTGVSRIGHELQWSGVLELKRMGWEIGAKPSGVS